MFMVVVMTNSVVSAWLSFHLSLPPFLPSLLVKTVDRKKGLVEE